MKNIVVLGAGMVGRAIAADLSRNFNVTSVDFFDEHLKFFKDNEYKVDTIKADFRNIEEIRRIVRKFDFVVGAVPGYMGFEILKNIILEKKNVVDISFFPENPFELDELAKENGVMAVVDMGVAPGMSNFILGNYARQFDVENFKCCVGGLPFERNMPFQYKAPFSPIDVIEEYTRPARFVVNSTLVTKEPLSDPELINFPHIGTLEAFNSDGLRTLINTMNVKNMIEKTLRYPGHIDLIKNLKLAGFFNSDYIEINGNRIKPVEFTNIILFEQWKLKPEDDEFTIMTINITGKKGNEPIKIDYLLYDTKDEKTGFSSMARTTGYAATSVVQLINEGLFFNKGIIPPELIPQNDNIFNFVIKYQEERKIIYSLSK